MAMWLGKKVAATHYVAVGQEKTLCGRDQRKVKDSTRTVKWVTCETCRKSVLNKTTQH